MRGPSRTDVVLALVPFALLVVEYLRDDNFPAYSSWWDRVLLCVVSGSMIILLLRHMAARR